MVKGLLLETVRLNRYLYMGVSEIRDTLFWGPDNKDPTIQGTILGSPIFGNSHIYKYIYKRTSKASISNSDRMPKLAVQDSGV